MLEEKVIELLLAANVLLVGALGFLIKYLFTKMMASIDEQARLHMKCREDFLQKFMNKNEFNSFLALRSQDHATINTRLHSMESQHKELMIKMDLFMKDTEHKLTRLSATFVERENAISQRLDNLADGGSGKKKP